MKNSLIQPLAILALVIAFLAGCGNSDSGNQAGLSTQAASESCIRCHTTKNNISKVTGSNILDEWSLSAHNATNGASCIDCHGSGNGHPNSCGGCHGGSTPVGAEFHNPEKTGMCGKCHNSIAGYELQDLRAGLTLNTQTAHFNNITGVNYPASFVSYNYVNNCRKCHNPHDTSSGINYNKDWARSAHGTTESLVNPRDSVPAGYDFRNITRHEIDFKTAGSFRPAAQEWSDNSSGYILPGTSTIVTYSSVCVRCHTSTGFINYVNSGFTDISPFGPADPQTGKPYRFDDYPKLTAAQKSKLSPDKTKELTNCNVCHDDGKGNAYSFKLRKVPQVTTYYNYSGRPASAMKRAIRSHAIQFPNAGDSNMCIVCHSGRLLGVTIKMADARSIDWTNTSRLVNHFRGAAQMMFQTSGFEFYTSSAMYSSNKYSHRYIGLNEITPIGTGPFAGDVRGHGPCIGCHLNSNGSDGATSHTLLPVNREASDTYLKDIRNPALPITTITSRACPSCHTGAKAWTASKLQTKKDEFRAAVEAFRQILAFALNTSISRVTFDGEGRPATPSNWYGNNTSGVRIQPWLRSTATDFVTGSEFLDPLDRVKYPVRVAAYNMGAAYNFFMFYYDPGAFAHNSAYSKRLMYDSIDWLDDGKLNGSVNDTFNGTVTGELDTLTLKTKLGVDWQKAYDYIMGESGGGRPTS